MINLKKDISIRYVVAFSGGADSALLAYLMKKEGYNFRLVHVVHPDSKASKDGESIRQFCERWATMYEIPITIIRISTDPSIIKNKGGEAAEREARYKALSENLLPNEALVTAHHLDDSIETFLFRLARGTSVKGLRGIQENSGKIPLFRPLLEMTKSQIMHAVEASAILYGYDSTNESTELSRGFIRNRIVPLFVEHFGNSKFYASMKRTMELMNDCSELLEDLYHIDIQACKIDETGIDRVLFGNLSIKRQRNLIHHLILKMTNIHLSKNGVDEICKKASSKKSNEEFTVSGIQFIIHKNVMRVTLPKK